MHYLVIDPRFGTPIYVFLEADPQREARYPGLAVQEVTLDAAPGAGGRRTSVGRDPNRLNNFREFASDGAVARAGFSILKLERWARYEGAILGLALIGLGLLVVTHQH